MGKIHYKWPFSIAMLNYQRVRNNISGNGGFAVQKWRICHKLNALDVGARYSLIRLEVGADGARVGPGAGF